MGNWLSRLQALNHPLLWSTGFGLILLTVAIRQYVTHPEWLGNFELAPAAPGQSSTDLLSPEQAAGLADIDNLSLLINQANPAASPPQPTNPEAPAAYGLAAEAPGPATGAEQPVENQSATTATNPFAAYLERTRFRPWSIEMASPESRPPQQSLLFGAGNNRSSLPSIGLNLLGSGSVTGLGADPNSDPSSPGLSPLQAALAQQALRPSNAPTAAEATPTPPDSAAPGPVSDELTPPPWLVQGSLGEGQPSFLQTVPQMSPPPGTTGYTTPPSLELAAPFRGQASTGASTLPAAAPVVPNLSPLAAPQLTPAPQVMTGPTSGPTGGSLYTQPQVIEAAPFTAPRPPGSHAGGGYIYTFSDPNGPAP